MLILVALDLIILMLGSAWQGEHKLEPVGKDFEPGHFCGVVVALKNQYFVIKPERGLAELEIKTLPDGTTQKRIYVQDNTQPPRMFVFQDSLFPNRPGPKTPRLTEHEVADVQVGDFVWIGCRRIKSTDYCVNLQIQRRPGGIVPRAIGDDKLTGKSAKHRVDVRYNAEQFLEEKVAPAILTKLPRMIPRFRM